jgi:hypothetical protein
MPWGKMSIRMARLLVVLTNVTGLNKGFNAALHVGKEEVSTNGCKHTSDATMGKQNM